VFVCWGSANRDETVFADAPHFKCPNEAGKDHFGFGYGVHFCVGNRLARTTLSIAFSAFLKRYQSISLEIPESDLRYMPAINLRALLSLPIKCELARTVASANPEYTNAQKAN
jgi:cytochrome P450